MRAAIASGGQCHHARLQRRFVAALAKGKTLLPHRPLADPLAQHGDLLGGHALAFRWHHGVLIGGGQHVEEQALARVLHVDHRAVLGAFQEVLARVHAQAALLFVPQMAVSAVLLEDGHHLMGEVDGRRGGAGEHEGESERAEGHGQMEHTERQPEGPYCQGFREPSGGGGSPFAA